MQTKSEIRQLLVDHGLRPRHRLGQHFLHDKNQIAKLLDAAAIVRGELALEVGPGTGTLTEALLERGARVIAIELDEGLSDLMEARLGGNDHFELVRGDALHRQRTLNPNLIQALGDSPFKLVANLPYQVASALMSTLLIEHENCRGQFVTIQKEVAERLTAKPSTKAYGPLSVIVQSLAEVERIATVSPSCFWPAPEVTSAMMAIRPKLPARLSAGEAKGIQHRSLGQGLDSAERRREFAAFVTRLFTKRRKQLGSIFGRDARAWPAGVAAEQRPEALSIEQLTALWNLVDKAG